MRTIRRAKLEDARPIHDAHMRSIQEICSRDHSPEEIMAWGNMPFHEDSRVKSISEQFVWVLDNEVTIEGYGHFSVEKRADGDVAHIYGLYFAPEAVGFGFGKVMVQIILAEVQKLGLGKVVLESTLTAHNFYLKAGFKDSGPLMTLPIGGALIRCIPMFLEI